MRVIDSNKTLPLALIGCLEPIRTRRPLEALGEERSLIFFSDDLSYTVTTITISTAM